MHAKLFAAPLGVSDPWRVAGVDFDVAKKVLTISVDFVAGSRFKVADVAGVHPVHDTGNEERFITISYLFLDSAMISESGSPGTRRYVFSL